MKRLLTIFRRSLHTIAIAVVICVVALYVAVHFNLAGLAIEHSLSHELAEKFETRVTVDGDIEVDWLNQVVINQLTIYDQQDDTLLYARRVLVAFDVWPLLQHHLVLNTCQLIDFDIRAAKDSLQGRHNFQFIVDALSEEEDDSQSFISELDLNAILLRMGQLSYDIKDQPFDQSAALDPNHIHIEQFSANLHLHDDLLQAKKMHFSCGQTSVKAHSSEMVLNPKQAMDEGGSFIFRLEGLKAENPTLLCQADVEGKGKEVMLQLNRLKLTGPVPGVSAIQDLDVQAAVTIQDILVPVDSLSVHAEIMHGSAQVDKLGATNVIASLDGTLNQAGFNCVVNTDKGEAHVEGMLTSDLDRRFLRVNGHCQSSNMQLDELLPASAEIGSVALDMEFDVKHENQQPLWLAVKGTFGRLDYRQHTYHDILFEGEGQGRQAKGKMQLADSLGSIDITFDVDGSHPQVRYRLDGDIQHLQPMALNLVKHEMLDSLAITGHLHTDILAEHWDKAEGVLNLTQLALQRGEEKIQMEPILFEGTADRGALTSQLLHLDYQRNRHDHSYHIEGYLPVANDLYALMRLPLRATSVTRFAADFAPNNQLTEAWLDIPAILTDDGQEMEADVTVKNGENGLLLPTINLNLKDPEHQISGKLMGEVRLSPLEVSLYPTTFLYNDAELKLAGAHMQRNDKGDYTFENFSLQGAGQRLSASGVVGDHGSNDLVVQLERFELGQIFSIFNKSYVDFEGKATGKIVLSSDPHTHLSTKDLVIEDFTYIDTLLGDARLNLDFALTEKNIEVECDITAAKQYTTHASGSIKLGERDSLDLYFDTDHLPLGFINYWSGSILQQFSGTATGPVRLYGDAKALQLAGDPVVDGRFTHDIIGAHFHLNDVVHLEENLMQFDNFTVDDCHGHTMQLNARVTHDHLRDFGYDVNLDLPPASQGFLVMDREQTPGRTYWGQLYISGQASLKGGNGHHRFNLNVATTDKSWFYLSPFEQDFSADNGDGYSFLTFRDKALLESLTDIDGQQISIKEEKDQDTDDDIDKTDIQVNMQVNATDQCQVTVQLDPLADDKLICRGTGDLTVLYDPRRDITLAGTYHISQGTYGMSMKGDLMSKVFQLQNTSTVRFSGVPSEAELGLKARYSIPSVNLTDLDESITTLGSLSRSTVPVDCMLDVTGQLSAPQVSFDLEVKNVSEEIQAYVHNVIGTQEMLNQEVLYLLLFSKFYTPQYAQSTQSHSGSEITSFASASITSQLNQLLGHMSNNFTMGTNFRTDRGDFSDMEMDVSLSTRLLGDRLLLNGNVGYRDPANRIGQAGNSNSFIGDFDLEFLINNSGTVRAKAYSHYNERDYSINNALTTQGIGFILRKDFQSFHDIWRRKK